MQVKVRGHQRCGLKDGHGRTVRGSVAGYVKTLTLKAFQNLTCF